MLESILMYLEGDRHTEYRLTLLYRYYAASGEALPISNGVHFVKDRNVFFARSQEVAV